MCAAQVTEGSEAVLTAYSKVGLGWLMAVLRFPLIRWAIDLLYSIVSKHRYQISRCVQGSLRRVDDPPSHTPGGWPPR